MSVVDAVGESAMDPGPDQSGAALTLPAKEHDAVAQERDPRVVLTPKRLPTTPVLALSILAAAVAFGLAAMQVTRAMNGEERSGVITLVEIGTALLAAAGVVGWTWLVVENARRLLAAAVSQNPLSPTAAARSWSAPLIVATAAIATVAYLERTLNEPGAESTSPIPLAVACAALIVTLFVSYRPLFFLSGMMRRLGSGAGDLARWVWVPISLAIVGGFTLFGLRSGGAYGEDFDGVAPAWAIGVVFVPPVVIVLVLAWRGGRLVEEAVRTAYDRRNGVLAPGMSHTGLGLFARMLRADARPPIHRDVRSRVRLVPGAGIVRLAMMISVAALTLISVVGALVMFLFWREAADGALLPAQRERAWNALIGLQSLERLVALGATVVASVWAFLSVLNARIASGRRRNPFLAALAWPGAAVAIWAIADRFDDTEEVGPLVTRFVLQAIVLYVPFFLLERAALAVGARRSPLRLAYALGVVLLVHIQGLGGLATLVEEADADRFGRVAGYLALAALLELIATVAITESSRVISDGAASIAEKHNFLAEQRAGMDARIAATTAPGPSIDDGRDDASPRNRKGTSNPVGDLVVGHDAAQIEPAIPVPQRPAAVDEAVTPVAEPVEPPAPAAAEPAASTSAAPPAAPEPVAAPAVAPVAAPAQAVTTEATQVVAPAPPARVPPTEPPAVAVPVTPVNAPPAEEPRPRVEPVVELRPDPAPAASASAPRTESAHESILTPMSLSTEKTAPLASNQAPTDQQATQVPESIAPVAQVPAPDATALGGAPADDGFSIPKLVHRSVVSDPSTTPEPGTDESGEPGR